ncbi:probable ADP-ribosylation factor GTPase-activating protein AGD14 [Magnolia sinica]|uniref:probable ADP-ribosylation factor GTPase-activating protein AGD14 n=1 Tax=Magnolia sinica TaxID=86752 RepID=UPI002657AC92|nr:probable ADP-ribosylation factor GTPase-activating protein AGD14 [Magnolia sinica]
MANRMKDDEKNEKIIRSLLKLPANRKCINCNSLGPQYVCTNFWTFVCTNCSGIHREFTHRVKSVSMAKFSSQEVTALQGGGNERAREIYFKEWDQQRHSAPDSSNVERLRDFIKHVYVDRRYTGERSIDKPPRVQNDREDYNENRRADTYRGGSRSPPYDDTSERRYNERSGPGGRNDDRNFRNNYDEKRSPGYDQENQRYGDYRRSPARFEVVDDWRRDDRFGNGGQNRRFEDRRFPDGPPKPEGRSPNYQKDANLSSPPIVRPVRDILGDDTPPLRIGDPPKTNGSRPSDAHAQTQRTTSSSSMGSTDGNTVEVKHLTSGSLIDFTADPEPPLTIPPNAPVTGQSFQQPTAPSVDGGNWASFDFAPQETTPQAPSSASSLDSALAQLSATATAPAGNMPTVPTGGVQSLVGGQWPTVQQHPHSLFTTSGSQSTVQQFAPVGGAPHNQGPSTAPFGQPSQSASKLPQEASSGAPSQPLPVEAKPSGRKELPADLFTLSYPPAPVPVAGWQTRPPHGMGFGMQYPTAVSMQTFPQPMPTFPQSSKSTNPFDLTSESTLPPAPTFPSMASLQGALPNTAGPSALLHTSNFATPSQRWVSPQTPSYAPTMPPQTSPYASAVPLQMPSYPSSVPLQTPSYPSAVPLQTPSYPSSVPLQTPSYPSAVPLPTPYASAMRPSAYMMQQTQNNMPTLGPQVIGGFGNDGALLGSLGVDKQPATRYPQPTTPNSFSSLGGNPFG